MEEPRGETVAAREGLDSRFVQPDSIVRLGGRHKAPSVEGRQIIGNRCALSQFNCAEGEVVRIVPENTADNVDERRLSVGASAIEQGQSLFGRHPGEAIANEPLHKGDELVVAREDVIKEAFPAWGLCIAHKGHAGRHGHQEPGISCFQPTTPQIEDTVGCSDEPRIGIPAFPGVCERFQVACEADEPVEPALGVGSERKRDVLFSQVWVVDLKGRNLFPPDVFECETVDLPITVRSPQRWGVDEPEAPTVVVPESVPVAEREPLRKAGLCSNRKPWGLLRKDGRFSHGYLWGCTCS